MHTYHQKIVAAQGEQELVEARATITDYSCQPTHTTLAAQYGLGWMEVEDESDVRPNVRTVEQEYMGYIMDRSKKEVDILKFWEVSDSCCGFPIRTNRAIQSNRKVYPTIYAIAMDYLPIQASSVPCERIFSSSAETDTRRRNRISPLVMEALQMLKCQFRTERMDFTTGWMTLEKHMTEDCPDKDLLQELLHVSVNDHLLDSVMKDINQFEDSG